MDEARRIVVVGDGGWGTALAVHLAGKGFDVALWSYDADYAEHMAETRQNPRYLPGFDIPPAIRITADFASCLPGADLLLSAVPTAYLRSVWSVHAPLLPEGLPVLSVSKGLEEGSDLRPTEILQEITGPRTIGVLSGPNIAREIALGMPAATVVASQDPAFSTRMQHTLMSGGFRVYSNPDPLGVELGGVLKNVVAIAAGMCDGLNLGVNAKAALCTRGVVEMARLGERLGGKRRTFFGMSGLGDLLTTCYSPALAQSHRGRAPRPRRGDGRHRGDDEDGRRGGEDLGTGPRPHAQARPGAADRRAGLLRGARGEAAARCPVGPDDPRHARRGRGSALNA